MVKNLQKSFLTIIVIALAGWLIIYAIVQKQADSRLIFDNRLPLFTENEMMTSSKLLHRKGMHAYTLANYQKAKTLFSMAVTKDVFSMESWLRLAETQLMLGHVKDARDILLFSISHTQRVMRWKWQQMLLARDLGMESQFADLANQLLRHRKTRRNTLQVVSNHYLNNTSKVLALLSEENRIDYLLWLIRWNRLEDSLQAWDMIIETGFPEKEVSLTYIQYLLRQKKITKASKIWLSIVGKKGITNGGFEQAVLQKAFGWRYSEVEAGKWRVQRTSRETRSGTSSLQLEFLGEENLNFHHISQIVPVDAGQKYSLIYAWKNRDITTDQGPFVEAIGYGCKKLYARGEMAHGNQPWREARFEIEVPADCKAALIRVRRVSSKRIDSKIAGTLWLDDFRLIKLKPTLAENTH